MSSNLTISKHVIINNAKLLVNGATILIGDNDTTLKELFKVWYTELGIEYPKFFKMDMLCQLAFLGSEALLRDTKVLNQYSKESIAILLSNSSASLDTDIRYQETISKAEGYFPSPAVFVYTLPSIMCGEIAIRNGIQGENNFLVTDGFDAGLLLEQVELLFSQTQTEVCIAGWVQLEGSAYKLVLFLVEKESKHGSVLFSTDNLQAIHSVK